MAYSLSPWLKPRFFITGTNRPLAGGLMYTYKAGTTDPAKTYSDDTGTENTNPIQLNTDGECDLFLDDSVSYRIILKNAAGVTQFDKDRIASLGSTQVQSFNSIAALRLRSGTTIANAAKTLGYYSAGDGGANAFYWDGTSVATDNGGTIIKPTSVSGAGRWLAVDTSYINVKQFGAVADGVTDDTTAIQAALDAAVVVSLPAGTYTITSTLVFNDWGKSLIGESIAAYGGTLSKSTLLHSFNGDLVRLNPVFSGPSGRHQIKFVQFKSNNVFTGVGLRITGSQDVVEGCAFYQFSSGGIRIGGVSYGTYIEKCSFDQCGSAGAYDISGDADTGASASNYNTITLIADNIFESSQTGAVSLKNSDPFYIIRNYIEPFNSASTNPMILAENSTSGNTRGWIQDNYIGSLLNANGFAISASGAQIEIIGNTCIAFSSGIFISSLTGVVTANKIQGFTSIGIQVSSVASGQNNNIVVSGNSLESKSTGAVHGIIMGASVNGVNVTGNLVRGKCDYYIRLLSCSNVLVSGNEIAPLAGVAASGSGIYEDTTNTSKNTVKGNSVTATTPYRRISFDYDIFYASAAPGSGDWVQGNIVWNSAPAAGGVPGWVCVTSGTPGTWKAMANLAA